MLAPGAGGRGAGHEQDGGEPDVAEHEAHEAPGQGDRKAPEDESDELEGLHGRASLPCADAGSVFSP